MLTRIKEYIYDHLAEVVASVIAFVATYVFLFLFIGRYHHRLLEYGRMYAVLLLPAVAVGVWAWRLPGKQDAWRGHGRVGHRYDAEDGRPDSEAE
ncbi:MAG: hypothetical protein GY851_02115 [bacterium]|nr:hypothetical protein [bacterium]